MQKADRCLILGVFIIVWMKICMNKKIVLLQMNAFNIKFQPSIPINLLALGTPLHDWFGIDVTIDNIQLYDLPNVEVLERFDRILLNRY